jgi:hypothetical protein
MSKIYLTAFKASGQGNGGVRSIPKVVSIESDDIERQIPVLSGASNHIESTALKVSKGGGRPFSFYQVAEKLGEVIMWSDFPNAASSPYNTGTNFKAAAAGTAQGTATALTAYHTTVTSACAGASLFGVRLPNASTVGNLGRAFVVKNAATTSIIVYPAASEILDSATTTSVTIAVGQSRHFYASATNKFVTARGPYA